jgi:hypothetical protein
LIADLKLGDTTMAVVLEMNELAALESLALNEVETRRAAVA